MHPSIFLTAEKVPGLRSLEEVRESIQSGLSKELWEDMLAELHVDMALPPYTPCSEIPGRRQVMAVQGNRDYNICEKAVASHRVRTGIRKRPIAWSCQKQVTAVRSMVITMPVRSVLTLSASR